MELKEAYKIVNDLALDNSLTEAFTTMDEEAMRPIWEQEQEAFKVFGEFMKRQLSPKAKKPEPFFLTPSMEAVLTVLLSEPRVSRSKYDIGKMSRPRMSDHVVSARISDLRKRGFDIQKERVKGGAYYLYSIPRS